MVSGPPPPPFDAVRAELQRLRQGQGLAYPPGVLRLSPELRAHLLGGQYGSASDAEQIVRLVSVLQAAVDRLVVHQRLHARVDLNLDPDHSFPTLTERQESLAQKLACTAKTVRRRADKALDALALLVAVPVERADRREDHTEAATENDEPWQRRLRRFWRLEGRPRLDIVCSEIPEEELPPFALPTDRNYLRYARFADLDSFVYAKTRLTQIGPDILMRDFTASEYRDSEADVLLVIGGPPWNSKYREFLPQLPYHFDPHPLGEDDPLVVPQLHDLTMGPHWAPEGVLLEDLAVFIRLTLARTTVYLLGGCLTLGVLGAARCFLHADHGARNASYLTDLVRDADFVFVTETRRVGGIIDVIDLGLVPPLLVLARHHHQPFEVVVDNTTRYPRAGKQHGVRRARD